MGLFQLKTHKDPSRPGTSDLPQTGPRARLREVIDSQSASQTPLTMLFQPVIRVLSGMLAKASDEQVVTAMREIRKVVDYVETGSNQAE